MEERQQLSEETGFIDLLTNLAASSNNFIGNLLVITYSQITSQEINYTPTSLWIHPVWQGLCLRLRTRVYFTHVVMSVIE